MTKREQLQLNIKTAKQSKKVAHVTRAACLKALRDARADYVAAADALLAAQAALVAFDNGEGVPQ